MIGITVQADLRVHAGELGEGKHVVGGDIDLGGRHADLLDQILGQVVGERDVPDTEEAAVLKITGRGICSTILTAA